MNKTSSRLRVALLVTSIFCAAGQAPKTASAQTSGTLFYTTYSSPEDNVVGTANKITYSFTGNSLTLGPPEQIHSFGTEGVDAFSLLPNGNLLIGGKDGTVHNIRASGSLVGNVSTGGAPGFHVSVSPNGNTAYTAGIPGPLSTIPLSPFGPGTLHPLTGDDSQVTSVVFDEAGHAFYTSSGARGNGSFGEINLNTFTTHRTLNHLPAAHGMVFDSFTQSLILVGSNHISQILPGDLTELRSDFQINLGSNSGSDRFDQVAVDGSGRLFATVNNGTILFMNYNFTGEVGSPANFVTTQFVQPFLTGVALVPNQGGGDGGIPLPAAAWTGFGMFTILALSKTCFRKWPALHSAA